MLFGAFMFVNLTFLTFFIKSSLLNNSPFTHNRTRTAADRMMQLTPRHMSTVTLLTFTCMALGICIPLVSSCCCDWTDSTDDYAADWNTHESLCGTDTDNGKIVGGSAVSSTTTWPWLALLERSDGGYCTAEIVARRFVTTAAHCVDGDTNVNQLTLRFRRTDRGGLSTLLDISRGVIRKWVHHDYVSVADSADSIPHSDMALLELDSALIYNSDVRPVCLPASDSIFQCRNCWAVGWGLKENNVMSNELRELKMRLLRQADCQAMVNANGWGLTLEDTNVCAEGYSDPDNQNTAPGDSGGPLMCKRGTTRWELQGMNSAYSHPDIFVRVSKFRQWITDCINEYGGPGPF